VFRFSMSPGSARVVQSERQKEGSMATQIARPLTYDDLRQTPDDGSRYEIIGGELLVSPSPTTQHQRLVFLLGRIVGDFVDEDRLGMVLPGPVDVRLGVHTIVVPDLLFVRAGRIDIVRAALVEGAPDLVVEVASLSTRGRDNVQKAAAYAEAGVPEYWLPDPERRAFRMLVLRDGIYRDAEPVDGRFHSTVIDGLALDPDALFADLA
jgi:Uma2 family endonuclease